MPRSPRASVGIGSAILEMSWPSSHRSSEELAANDGRAGAQRLQLSERGLARKVLHSAVRRRDEPFGRDMLQGGADPLGHSLGRFDRRLREIDDAEHDGLA